MKTFKVLILLLISSVAYAEVFPPYYFSANVENMINEKTDAELLEKYVTMDYFSPKVQFIDNRTLTDGDMKKVMDNRNVGEIKDNAEVGYAFTKKSTNMKMLPTNSMFQKSAGSDFDYNQYTRLGAFAPLIILHKSSDDKFLYVQADHMRGWVEVADVNIVDANSFTKYFSLPYLQVVADDVVIGGTTYNIGDKVPLISSNGDTFLTFTPMLETAEAMNAGGGYEQGTQKYSDDMMKYMISGLLGVPYDWGGRLGDRDCSAFVRDLWLVFGVDLPRNTGLQVQVGKELIGKPESKAEFFKVLDDAKPFKTLIFFNGHVIMYGGKAGGDYIIFHAVSRLKNDNGDIEDISSVVKQYLKKDGFTGIWERVVKVTDISGLMK